MIKVSVAGLIITSSSLIHSNPIITGFDNTGNYHIGEYIPPISLNIDKEFYDLYNFHPRFLSVFLNKTYNRFRRDFYAREP